MSTARRDNVQLRAARGGFTILELLIVITIMLALTAMAIPLLAPSREDRRVNESTRIVTSMFAGARARAIEIGRPVGVTLELDPANPTRSLTMSYSEVPAPYSGGFVNSRIIIEGEPTTGDTDMSGAIDGSEFTDWNGNGYYDAGGFITSITSDGCNPDTTWMGLIRPGDSLKLNYQGYEYTVGLPAMFAGNLTNGYFNALDPNNPWQLATITGGAGVAAGVVSDAATVPKTPFYEDPNGMPAPDGRFTPGTDTGGLPFQIIRLPYRSAGQTQTLPETMCIDLTASSTAADLIPLLWPSNATATGDITILYNPGGSIDSIRWGGGYLISPIGPVFLMVGKTALVGGNVAPKPGEPTYNWQDLDARWVMINHQSGLLASNPTSSVDATNPDLGIQITQSRLIAREGIKIGDK